MKGKTSNKIDFISLWINWGVPVSISMFLPTWQLNKTKKGCVHTVTDENKSRRISPQFPRFLDFLNSFQTHFIKWHCLKTVIFFLRWKLHLHSHSEYCFFCATYWSTRTMIYVHVLYMDNFKKVKIYPQILFLWWFRLVNLLW